MSSKYSDRLQICVHFDLTFKQSQYISVHCEAGNSLNFQLNLEDNSQSSLNWKSQLKHSFNDDITHSVIFQSEIA